VKASESQWKKPVKAKSEDKQLFACILFIPIVEFFVRHIQIVYVVVLLVCFVTPITQDEMVQKWVTTITMAKFYYVNFDSPF
jgi:hypothetical protein